MATSAVPVIHAFSRAEPARSFSFQLDLANQKFSPARWRLTNSFYSKIATTIPNKVQFILKSFIARSDDVASLTRWSQIVEIIILGISIKMVSNQSAWCSSLTGQPIYRYPATMTWMRSWTYRFVQNETMLWNSFLNTLCQRMTSSFDVFIGRYRHPLIVHHGR